MRKLVLTTCTAALVLGVIFGAQTLGAGGSKQNLKSDALTGYQEATPAGVSSNATGSFEATIDDDAGTISYTLTYGGLSAPATVAHIHFGNRFDSGGVSVFFCGGGTKPAACPAGTADMATLSGTWTAADVLGPTAQGISAGEFNELVAAMRAGMTYANVHDSVFPQGEIRAQVNDDNQRQQ